MSDFIEFLVFVLVAWFVVRFIARLLPRTQRSEPGDFAGKFARIRPRPKKGAGAVALAEPDDDEEKP